MRQLYPVQLSPTNCQVLRGLKYVAKNRIERLRAIAHELAASSYDIISLQEIWVYSDYEYVRDSILSRLPYSKFFYRYVEVWHDFFASYAEAKL